MDILLVVLNIAVVVLLIAIYVQLLSIKKRVAAQTGPPNQPTDDPPLPTRKDSGGEDPPAPPNDPSTDPPLPT